MRMQLKTYDNDIKTADHEGIHAANAAVFLWSAVVFTYLPSFSMQKAAFTRKMTEFPCESLPFTCMLIVKSEKMHAFSDEITSMNGVSDNFNGIFLPVASWIGVFSVLSLNKLRCSTWESLRSVYRSGCERPSSQFETELRSMPTCFATSICRKQSFSLAS